MWLNIFMFIYDKLILVFIIWVKWLHFEFSINQKIDKGQNVHSHWYEKHYSPFFWVPWWWISYESSYLNRVWKIQDFPITQILHEINLWDSRCTKTAYFAILVALNFVTLVNFSLQKIVKIHKNQNPKSLNMLKWQILHL